MKEYPSFFAFILRIEIVKIPMTPYLLKKQKGQDKNPAPFLNPISYEKPL